MAKKSADDLNTGVEAVAAALAPFNPVAAKAWLDLTSEGAAFLTRRFERDLEMQKKMLACGTPAELLELQAAFLAEVSRDYADEMARCMKMFVEASGDVLRDAQSGHRREYDDIPL